MARGSAPSDPPRRARLRAAALAAGFGIAAALAIVEIGLRALTRPTMTGMPRILGVPLLPFRPPADVVDAWWDETARSRFNRRDPELGWTIGPNAATVRGEHVVTSNADGARAAPDRVYPSGRPVDRLRVVAVGDSFTFGDGVALEHTWPALVETLDPGIEVVNLGVPGHGTDQALLRWRRDGRPLDGHVVVLGLWPDQVARNVSVVNYYLAPFGGFQSKPRFLLRVGGDGDDGRLQLVGSPIAGRDELVRALADPAASPRLRHDEWMRPAETVPRRWHGVRTARFLASLVSKIERRRRYREFVTGGDAAATALTVEIAAQLAREVRAAGARPLVVMFPRADLLDEFPGGGRGARALPVVAALRERGLETLDLAPPFAERVRRDGARALFQDEGGGHLTPAGNRLAAEHIAERVRRDR